MELLPCEVFAITTLVVTAVWVWYGRNWSFPTLAWAMFFPGLFAPWFVEDQGFMKQVLWGTKKVTFKFNKDKPLMWGGGGVTLAELYREMLTILYI